VTDTWIERMKPGRRIHASDPENDIMTLCCRLVDGMASSERGLINCPTCLSIIRHCKSFPSKMLAGGRHG
jgi:hypothetical protein